MRVTAHSPSFHLHLRLLLLLLLSDSGGSHELSRASDVTVPCASRQRGRRVRRCARGAVAVFPQLLALSLSLSPPSLPRSPFSQAAAAEATSGSLPRFGEVPGTTFTYDDDQEGVISPPLALPLATSAATETSARSKARGQQQTRQRLRPQFPPSISVSLNVL